MRQGCHGYYWNMVRKSTRSRRCEPVIRYLILRSDLTRTEASEPSTDFRVMFVWCSSYSSPYGTGDTLKDHCITSPTSEPPDGTTRHKRHRTKRDTLRHETPTGLT